MMARIPGQPSNFWARPGATGLITIVAGKSKETAIIAAGAFVLFSVAQLISTTFVVTIGVHDAPGKPRVLFGSISTIGVNEPVVPGGTVAAS